jgi:hypothetical protein
MHGREGSPSRTTGLETAVAMDVREGGFLLIYNVFARIPRSEPERMVIL